MLVRRHAAALHLRRASQGGVDDGSRGRHLRPVRRVRLLEIFRPEGDVEHESAKGRGRSAGRELGQTLAGEKGSLERRASAPDVHGVRDAGQLRRSRRRDQDPRSDPGRSAAARALGGLLRARGIFGPRQPGRISPVANHRRDRGAVRNPDVAREGAGRPDSGRRRRLVPTAMPLLSSLKQRARHLKSETLALWFAARHPGTPWYAKLLVAGIVAYALSPIDLIPDFVPVLGYLDDLILIPLGIVLAIRMIPGPILEECRARARLASARPVSRVAALAIVAVWITAAALCGVWAYRIWFRP